MTRPLRLAGGAFDLPREELVQPPIDWSRFDPGRYAPERLQLAQRTWLDRLHTEYTSAQILTRFAGEVQAAGDPFDVWVWAQDLVRDELSHVELCRQACLALGVEPSLPDPKPMPESFMQAPMPQRAMHTAIAMLAINETLSVAFIQDLAERCETPGLKDVLHRTVADEAVHGESGWAYLESSLERFPRSSRPGWRKLAEEALAGHRRWAAEVLEGVAPSERRFEAQPDEGLIELGLFGSVRQALVLERTLVEELEPRLRALHLM